MKHAAAAGTGATVPASLWGLYWVGLALLSTFLVLFEPIRGYLYWYFEDSAFGVNIGGTGGVGGQLGLTTCPSGAYCFWHDIPLVGLTYLSLVTVLWWWGGWLLLALLSALGLPQPSFFIPRLRPANSYFGMRPRSWMLSGALVLVVWAGSQLNYYFGLTTYYRDQVVLGVSLAAACALMLVLSVLLLSLGRWALPLRILQLGGYSIAHWPSQLPLHKVGVQPFWSWP